MTKAFISYHHDNDQKFKEHLSWMAWYHGCFEDGSVRVGDIDDDRSSESIRRLIRDEYLLDTEVTILLCGTETRDRKHVDWELKSSMIDGQKNRKSGILVINLPGVADDTWHADLPDEKSIIYADYTGEWVALGSRAECQDRYPLMPERIIDQLLCAEASVSVVPWVRATNNPRNLRWLVDQTASAGRTNIYDLSRPMRRRNHIRSTSTLPGWLTNREGEQSWSWMWKT